MSASNVMSLEQVQKNGPDKLTVAVVVVWFVALVLVATPRTPKLYVVAQRTPQPRTQTTRVPASNPNEGAGQPASAEAEPPRRVNPYLRPDVKELVTRWVEAKSEYVEEPNDSTVAGYSGNALIVWFQFSADRFKEWLVAQYVITVVGDSVCIAEYKLPALAGPAGYQAKASEYGDVYAGKTRYSFNAAGKLIRAEHFDERGNRDRDLELGRAADNTVVTVRQQGQLFHSPDQLGYNRAFLRRDFALWDRFGQYL